MGRDVKEHVRRDGMERKGIDGIEEEGMCWD